MFMWPKKDDPPELQIFCAVWWGVAGALAVALLLVYAYGLFVLVT